MRDQFIPYELALKLKELGFVEPCLTKWGCTSFRLYENYQNCSNKDDIVLSGDFVSAPLWQQAFDWFRVNNTPSEIRYIVNINVWDYRITKVGDKVDNSFYSGIRPVSAFTLFEEARLDCLLKLIELCQK